MYMDVLEERIRQCIKMEEWEHEFLLILKKDARARLEDIRRKKKKVDNNIQITQFALMILVLSLCSLFFKSIIEGIFFGIIPAIILPFPLHWLSLYKQNKITEENREFLSEINEMRRKMSGLF